MEQYFAVTFEGVRHERSLILLISLTDPDILRQSKFTDDEINLIKNALEKLHRQDIERAYRNGSVGDTSFYLINEYISEFEE